MGWSHALEHCHMGIFSCISLGADYYSGGVVVELPLQRRRVTDLENVEPRFLIKDDGNIEIHAEIKTHFGSIIKVVEVSINSEKVSFSYIMFQNGIKLLVVLGLG